MARLVINHQKVTKAIAEQLIELCPFNAIEAKGDSIDINSACKMCKLCIKKGPAGVITYVEDTAKVTIDKSQWVGTAVFIEHHDGEIHPVSLELIGKAHDLVKEIKHPVFAVVIGSNVQAIAEEVNHYGVDKIFVYDDPRLEHFDVVRYAACMEHFVIHNQPSTILYGGTLLGRSFAPRVASRFRTGLTADCTILGMKSNTDLIQNRPAFGGNIMASIVCPNNRPQMATVRYKIFPMPEKVKPRGVIEHQVIDFDLTSNMKLLASNPKPKDLDITECDVLVAIGRGFRTPEAIAMAQELADLLGGQIAVTRPLIEDGLYPAQRQIGLSGRTVAPKLLISIGISGAVHYTAGMRGAQLSFAINTDRHAPIFDAVHYGLVGDAYEIVPQLIADIKKIQGAA